jgi:hypothetical protein
LISDMRAIAVALAEEEKLRLQGGDTGPQIIKIEGGLPALPGTNITYPTLNGRA